MLTEKRAVRTIARDEEQVVVLPLEPDAPSGPSDRTAPRLEHTIDGDHFRVLVVERTSAARVTLFACLELLEHHLEWAGKKHGPGYQHVVELSGPARALRVGDTFVSRQTTSQGFWHDRSTVVRADPPEVFAFETQGIHLDREGRQTASGQWQHRYELHAESDGGTLLLYTCLQLLVEGDPVTPFAAVTLANNVHRGVLNLVELAQRLEAATVAA